MIYTHNFSSFLDVTLDFIFIYSLVPPAFSTANTRNRSCFGTTSACGSDEGGFFGGRNSDWLTAGRHLSSRIEYELLCMASFMQTGPKI